MYKQADDAARIRALEAFMEGKGLSRHSTPAEITVRQPSACQIHLNGVILDIGGLELGT